MGRHRQKKLSPGSQTTLYIPQDVDQKTLEWLNSQSNLSNAIIEVVKKVANKSESVTDNIDLNNLARIVQQIIMEQEYKKVDHPVKGEAKKREAIRRMRL